MKDRQPIACFWGRHRQAAACFFLVSRRGMGRFSISRCKIRNENHSQTPSVWPWRFAVRSAGFEDLCRGFAFRSAEFAFRSAEFAFRSAESFSGNQCENFPFSDGHLLRTSNSAAKSMLRDAHRKISAAKCKLPTCFFVRTAAKSKLQISARVVFCSKKQVANPHFLAKSAFFLET